MPNTALSQYGTEIAGCLTARGDSSPCADRGQNIVCMTGTQAHCHISDEIAGCLTAHMGKDDAPVVVGESNLQTYVCETAHSGSNGLGVGEADIFPTLDTSSGPAVWARENAVRPPFGFAQNVRSESGPIAMGDAIEEKSMGSNPMLVRRLTPLECERLQGFPDGHTLIAWKGKPAGECPDGPRYKAIGNSMAVPVMRWIGRRIAAAATD